MTATMKVTNLQNESSATPNIVLNADGTTTIPTQSTTNLSYTGTLTGGTGVINIGSGQLVKDASGNLGLGVTPSAWDGSFKAIQVSNASLFSQDSTGAMWLSKNARNVGGTWYYIGNGFASYVEQGAGAHKFYTAPSGTAGNAISFTQAMTLTAAGDLGVGATSPAQKLHVIGSAIIQDRLLLQRSSGSLNLAIASFWDGAGSPLSGTKGDLLAIGNSGGSDLVFVQNNTERARIDSSGNLLVGTTNANPGYGNTAVGVRVSNSMSNFSASTVDWVITVNQNSNDGSNRYLIGFRNANVNVGNITGNGTSVAYNTSSDYRLKENVQPMQNALATVAALKPCTYTWKSNGNAGQGFIAHELQAVVPDAVTGEKDAVDADGNPKYQGVDTSFLVATLTAAIQEQQAIITQLQADVAALKGAA